MDEIEIYWWNGGEKTLDFSGSYKEFFKKKDITIRKISNESEKYRFRICWSSCNATFDICSHPKDAYREAVKIFLAVLGDKTLFIDHYNREIKLNW